jgi:MFS transporter, DHA2 family, glioxin efflux transporter
VCPSIKILLCTWLLCFLSDNLLGWGKAFKYFGLKSSFLVAVFVFELGSLICAVAPNSTTLIVGRAIAGSGAAGIAGGAYTIIGFAVKPQMRPAFTGVLGAT